MTSETPFRIALAVVIVLTMAVTVYHRRRAAASREKISWQTEGYAFAIVLRLAGVWLWATTLAYLFVPSSVQWASLAVPPLVRWCGVIVAAACPALFYWTLGSLGTNLTDTVVTRSDATLVTNGPYRWVRHPFYVVTGLLMAAVTALTANWLIGLASFTVLTLLVLRTPKEEQMLLARFGTQYREYLARTGRFIPRRPE